MPHLQTPSKAWRPHAPHAPARTPSCGRTHAACCSMSGCSTTAAPCAPLGRKLQASAPGVGEPARRWRGAGLAGGLPKHGCSTACSTAQQSMAVARNPHNITHRPSTSIHKSAYGVSTQSLTQSTNITKRPVFVHQHPPTDPPR